LGVTPTYRPVHIGKVRSITLAEGANRTRVVVQLTGSVAYKIQLAGNQIRVRLHGGGASASRLAAAPAAHTSGITDIDFRRTQAGGGQITVGLRGMRAPVDISQKGGKIVARFPGADLPQTLQKRLDVIDFATPVKYVDAVAGRNGAIIRITPITDANYEQVAYQTDDRLIIELQPVSEAEQRRKHEKEYDGKRISLSFQNVDIRAILQILADVAGVNMVVSESVSGTMALQLENVPWDQVLDIVLKAQGLGMRRQGNVIMVAPLAEIAAREKAELAAQQATVNLAPLVSELIQVNYARAADLAALLTAGEVSVLSPRGQVLVDERTNTLLVYDTRTKLEQIRGLVDKLDVPISQVLIEARIVVANREFARNLGVSAGVSDQGSLEGGDYVTNTGFTVNLPVAAPAGTLATSIIGNSFNLNLALSAMESENHGEVISSPRVITTDGLEAQIEQGVEIPYLEAASSGAATVSFKEAVLSLTVTPQITPNEHVLMSLEVTQDTQGDAVSVQGGGAVPSINTRSLTTQVLVENGDTVVLGGIYQQENREVVTKVPVLGDIPLLGALFRNTNTQHDKRELLIFITPKVLERGAKLN
ncbi:MAG: type IV pilus secretin PilQ, partial [Salinisphaera sp.]|nr:type IV pilus secretin PilQ [Salinisphaera sp.]